MKIGLEYPATITSIADEGLYLDVQARPDEICHGKILYRLVIYGSTQLSFGASLLKMKFINETLRYLSVKFTEGRCGFFVCKTTSETLVSFFGVIVAVIYQIQFLLCLKSCLSRYTMPLDG